MDVLLMIITSFLGAYAGAEGTSLGWRRIGIPVVVASYLCMNGFGWVSVVCAVLLCGVLSIGYGIPDGEDEGSFLGRLLRKDLLVRGFIGFLLSLSLLPLVLSGASYGKWLWGGAFLMCVWGAFGGDDVVKDEGSIRFLGKELLIEDLILYGTFGGYVSWLVK